MNITIPLKPTDAHHHYHHSKAFLCYIGSIRDEYIQIQYYSHQIYEYIQTNSDSAQLQEIMIFKSRYQNRKGVLINTATFRLLFALKCQWNLKKN